MYTCNNILMLNINFIYLVIVLAIILVVSVFVILCNYRNIRIAIAVIKTACTAIKDMPLMLLVPPVFTVFIGSIIDQF